MAEQVDWCRLPEDLLLLILKRLPILDYLRVGAVCTALRSIASKKLCPPAPQLPWLMLPNHRTKALNFYYLSTKKVYKPKMPGFSPYFRKRWIGSCSGWLMSMDENAEIHLMNPFSKSKIRLRPATKLPNFSPVNKGGCIVFVIHGLFNRLAYCKSGNEKWTELHQLGHSYTDIIYYKGKFYGVNFNGSVIACDLSGASPKVTEIAQFSYEFNGFKNLVESQGGFVTGCDDFGIHEISPPKF